MDETFRNAPLLEIIAELRWQAPYPSLPQAIQPLGGQSAPTLLLGSTQVDSFLHRFGSEVYKLGFQRMERLFPSGLPMLQGQPVARYRSDAGDLSNVIYQVGAGIFSANAVPPYRSWKHFAPSVQAGLNALLQAREDHERTLPFDPVSLRYIDAFKPDLTGGRDVADFLSEVLKIELRLPDAIIRHLAPDQSPKPFVNLTIPIVSGVIRMTVGEAMVSGSTAILFDTTLSTNAPVNPEIPSIMSAFVSAHSIIHDIFMQLTAPIRHLMQPEQ